MKRNVWAGAAVLVLVGCGGKTLYDGPPADPPVDHPLPQPYPKPTPAPYPTMAPVPTAEPTSSPPPNPTPSPPAEPVPIVLPFVCRSIQTDAQGVHLVSLTFSFGLGAELVDVGPSLALSAAEASTITALGRQGDSLYACSAGKVIRIAVADASIERSAVTCDAVTADDAAIWIQSSGRGALERYDDYAKVLAGEPSATFAPLPSNVIGVAGSVVIAAVDHEVVPGGPNAVFQQILRIDTVTGERSSTRISVSGKQQGVDLASDGYFYFADESHGYGRMNAKGADLTWTSTGVPSPAAFHGMICQ